MAYVATVNTIYGGTLTGTSYIHREESIVLTGSLAVTSPANNTDQYLLSELGAATAVIPTGHIKTVTVA